jgi:hypothetical protein
MQMPLDEFSEESNFVGFAVLNPALRGNRLIATGFDSPGSATELSSSLLSPLSQISLLTAEMATGPDLSLLAFEGTQELLLGYLTVGDTRLGRLDGVKGDLQTSNKLFFPMAGGRMDREIAVFLLNPNAETSQLTLNLVNQDGSVLEESVRELPALGSLVETGKELFDNVPKQSGYIFVEADLPVKGFQISANEQNVAAYSAQAATRKGRLSLPHFIIGPRETTQLRLINAGNTPVTAGLKVWDDLSVDLGSTKFTIGPRELFIGDLKDLLDLRRDEDVSGFIELELSDKTSGAAKVIGTVTYEADDGRSSAALTLPENPAKELIIAHIVESAYHQIFTRLVILNPQAEALKVELAAFDASGRLSGATLLELAPRSKVVDSLASDRFLGSDFQQVGGHLRLTGSLPFHSLAFFGDFTGEFLATIEAQDIPPQPEPSRRQLMR